MLRFTHSRREDFRVMPWKDGGGETTELAIEPSGATVQDAFLWRLSMARVERSGPFSRFPGTDRSLLILEGAGMELDLGDGKVSRLMQGDQSMAFSGDGMTQGRLLNGPVLDFNLISDRQRLRHRVERRSLKSEAQEISGGPLRFIFCVSGRVAVEPWTGRLEARELLRVDGEGALSLKADDHAEVLIVQIEARGQG